MYRIGIYDKDLQWVRPLGVYKKIAPTKRHNRISGLEITMRANAPENAALAVEGARMVVSFRDRFLMSGTITNVSGEGPGIQGEMVFTLEDDFRIFHNYLGYQNPDGTLAQQNLAEQYTITGPAETVVKTLVTKNITPRAPYPVVVAPDLGRGDVITVSVRMDYLADKLFPAVTDAGIGVSVRQLNGQLVVDCYEPTAYPNKLTEGSRVIQKWKFNRSHPTVTDAVIGSDGEGIARDFYGYQDAVRRALYRDRIESFGEAKFTPGIDAFLEAGNQLLADGAAKAGVDLELAEAGNFRYGVDGGPEVGDLLTAVFGGNITVTDFMTEVAMEHTPGDGLKITSTIGRKDDPAEQVVRAITALAMGLHTLKAST
jgi:hypothetical protein